MDRKAITSSIIFLVIMPIAITILIIVHYAISDQRFKLGAISLALLLALITIIIVYNHFFSTHNRLKRKLAAVPSVTQGESIEKMKQHYNEIYLLYTKLSEHRKQNYYAQITEIRTRIERKLKADKKMELLIQNIGRGSLDDQKNNYQELFELYQRLPDSVKTKYYPHLAHARNLLERSN